MTAGEKRSGQYDLLSRSPRAVHACFLLIISASLLTACSAQSSTGQLAAEMQTVSSWAATARRVGEAWLSGSLPTAYTQRTLQTAEHKLEEEMDTLSKSRHVSIEQGARLLEQAQSLKQIVGRMQASVGQADRNAVGQQLEQISSQQEAIGALKQGTGGPQR